MPIPIVLAILIIFSLSCSDLISGLLNFFLGNNNKITPHIISTMETIVLAIICNPFTFLQVPLQRLMPIGRGRKSDAYRTQFL